MPVIKMKPTSPGTRFRVKLDKSHLWKGGPHEPLTEKTSLAMQNTNTYSFRVRRDSTKPDIKAAVELMFGVKVDKVAVVNETGKSRRFGKLQGRTQDIKKAYVRLAPGQTIDYEAKLKA